LILYFLSLLNVDAKCYWTIWGGDLYDFQHEHGLWKKCKSRFIKNLAGIVTPIKGDYLLAKSVYGSSARYFDCLLYLSNVVTQNTEKPIVNDTEIRILIGHSADRGGCHKEIIDKLIEHGNANMHLILPMSYGDLDYANYIESYVKSLHTDVEINVIRNFLPIESYKEMLNTIKCAVFNYERQQGVGNIIQLLSNGATIYLHSTVTTWEWLKSMGITVKDVKELYKNGFIPITEVEREENILAITKRASVSNLINEWKNVFEN